MLLGCWSIGTLWLMTSKLPRVKFEEGWCHRLVAKSHWSRDGDRLTSSGSGAGLLGPLPLPRLSKLIQPVLLHYGRRVFERVPFLEAVHRMVSRLPSFFGHISTFGIIPSVPPGMFDTCPAGEVIPVRIGAYGSSSSRTDSGLEGCDGCR